MTKYIEELKAGDTIVYNDQHWLLTIDFKKNGQRLAYSLNNGSPLWMDPSAIVDINPIYSLDDKNNIIPIKQPESKPHV